MAENGKTRFNGKILKCNSCNKQVKGKAVIELFERQIGSSWCTERNDDDTSPERVGEPEAQSALEEVENIEKTDVDTASVVNSEPHRNENEAGVRREGCDPLQLRNLKRAEMPTAGTKRLSLYRHKHGQKQ